MTRNFFGPVQIWFKDLCFTEDLTAEVDISSHMYNTISSLEIEK